MSLLELEQVSRIYGNTGGFWTKNQPLHAVSGISFAMEEGERIGIAGESGSGKSTLGKLILGLERPDTGTIRFQGIDWLQASPRQRHRLRRNLQAVFQDYRHALNPRLTAGQVIAEPIRNYERLTAAELKRRQIELMEAVGLREPDLDKRPDQFSGGQQQRLNIARAIALRPKLIVFDEAVSSLDMLIQAQILELLNDLAQQFKLSYLFITHDLRAACCLCSRILVMEQGRIAESLDDPGQMGQLVHPASRKLLNAQLIEHPRERNIGRAWHGYYGSMTE